MHRSCSSVTRPLTLIAVLACVGLVPNLARASDDPPLKGPKANDQSVPGETRRFGTDQQGDRKDRHAGIQHGMFMRAVNALKGEKAEARVRLSDEQAQKIDAIDREFREQVRGYLAKNSEEVKKLMADLPENERKRLREGVGRGLENAGVSPKAAKGKGKRALDADASKNPAPADPQKAAAAKVRLKEIHEGAPQSTEVHARIFGVLNVDQKAAVEATLKKAKDEHAAKLPDADEKSGGGIANAAREKLREKLKDMTPEERRAAVKKLRERRAATNDDAAQPKK